MWIRLAIAPWWVSWTVTAVLTAAIFGPLWLLLQESDTTVGRPILITAVAFGLTMATLTTIAQRPIRRSLAAAVSGLDRARRAQAITATRRGDIPTDPAVLAASTRLCTISLGGRHPAPGWATSIPWIGPAVFTAVAGLNFAAGHHRAAIGYTAIAALLGATNWWNARVRADMRARSDLMNAAAEHNGAAVVAAEADLPAVMSMRRGLLIAVPIGLLVGVVIVFGTLLAERPQPSCQHEHTHSESGSILDACGKH
jgi:hypothetical protein